MKHSFEITKKGECESQIQSHVSGVFVAPFVPELFWLIFVTDAAADVREL